MAAGQAWAIDCTKAKIAVEKRICGNPKLVRQDRILNLQYQMALDRGDHPEQIEESQIRWLKQVRANCSTDDCLFAAYRERILALINAPRFRWVQYTDPMLGVQLMVPSNRRVVRKGNELSICSFRSRYGDYLIHFVVGNGDLEDGAKASGIFEKRDGAWHPLTTGIGTAPARQIKGDGWSGMMTVITCEIHDPETGPHAAAGECLWAVASDGKRYIVADTPGIPSPDDDIQRPLMTLKFLPRKESAPRGHQ